MCQPFLVVRFIRVYNNSINCKLCQIFHWYFELKDWNVKTT